MHRKRILKRQKHVYEEMPVCDRPRKPLVGVIDDGTKTVRFVVYEAECSEELASHELDKSISQPKEGWYEQDAHDIVDKIRTCAEVVVEKLTELGYTKDDIVALGITNQRETTVAWDKYTGKQLHNAIIWNDIRTDSTVDATIAKVPDQNKNYLKHICGLPISPYFSALKMRWMKDNVKSVRRASRDKRLLFGTIDAWILWNLTGGPVGGVHKTDVTNASRTMLMNLETVNWDPMLCRLFGIHRDTLPQIKSSSEYFGTVRDGSILDGIKITGILGNQQAALLGQSCMRAGQAKNTYRSGCFLLYNTGARRVLSSHGLLTTVAYRLGPNAPVVYALEGSIAVAGGAIKFLRDNLKLCEEGEEEIGAARVSSTGDVYFVPALNGLYAPYWRKDARGIICGLTSFTTKNHIIRAALEAVCFQTRDILEAMDKDCGMPLSNLHVDGRMISNRLLMQLQADLIGMPVLIARSWDMSALGAAVAAGAAVGAWDLEQWAARAADADPLLPTTTVDDRNARYTKWKMAVQRSLGWATTKKSLAMTGQKRHSLSHSDVSPPDSRQHSIDDATIDRMTDVKLTDAKVTDDVFIEELMQYSARKFSIFVPLKSPKDEHTILDDADYYMSKKECDYGVCQCCEKRKKLHTDWQTIEDIIENDPEIIFDEEDHPIVLEKSIVPTGPVVGIGVSLKKRFPLHRLPSIFRSITNKITHNLK
ncbi:glycerol kinase isoform X2 [Aricia agestis]|uniref:glycerol kinase isoform X2 n=1 Tax=Aricia agestis TaxID=91739 RepID=UPI001C209DB7|nr:glycerol kinase isoform X2 [Aricia agestis]